MRVRKVSNVGQQRELTVRYRTIRYHQISLDVSHWMHHSGRRCKRKRWKNSAAKDVLKTKNKHEAFKGESGREQFTCVNSEHSAQREQHKDRAERHGEPFAEQVALQLHQADCSKKANKWINWKQKALLFVCLCCENDHPQIEDHAGQTQGLEVGLVAALVGELFRIQWRVVEQRSGSEIQLMRRSSWRCRRPVIRQSKCEDAGRQKGSL